MKCLLLVCSLLFQISNSNAQELSLKISEQQFLIGESSFEGYSTDLPFSYVQIKKEWWRYIKKIALLENNKTHYVITFPASKNESNSDLSFVSTTENNESHTTLKAALKDQSLKSQYKQQAKNLLLGFKVKFYTSVMQEQINKSEKEASKLSQSIDIYKKRIDLANSKKERGRGNRVALNKDILNYEKAQDSLNIKLQAVQIQIEQQKDQLNKIK